MEEEIQLIQGLNRSTKRDVGLYVELKYPSLHERQGKDVVGQTLKVLSRFGYSKLTDKAFVQCFESAPLKRIRKQKLSNLRLTQLIGDNRWGIGADDYDVMQTEDGLKSVATYAHGVGPWLGHIVKETTSGGQRNITTTPLVTWAQEAGLVVHPYTFRRDSLPKGFTSFDKLIDLFVNKLKVNGLITDHPDLRSLISKR